MIRNAADASRRTSVALLLQRDPGQGTKRILFQHNQGKIKEEMRLTSMFSLESDRSCD